MTDRYQGMSDFDVVSGNRPADAPEMMRRLKDAVSRLQSATEKLHARALYLNYILVCLTVALVLLAIATFVRH